MNEKIPIKRVFNTQKYSRTIKNTNTYVEKYMDMTDFSTDIILKSYIRAILVCTPISSTAINGIALILMYDHWSHG